jgi:hypothetical protein
MITVVVVDEVGLFDGEVLEGEEEPEPEPDGGGE